MGPRRRPDSSTERSRAAVARLNRTLGGGVGSGGRVDHRDLFLDRGKGPYVRDLDGNSYIDYLLGFGPLILGHAPSVLVDAVAETFATGTMFGAACAPEMLLAEEVAEVFPCVDKVRFTNSGTEAVQACIRLARAVTGCDKILKFEGHFHGWADNIYLSVKPAGASGLAATPWTSRMTAGQPESVLKDVVMAPWNDREGFSALMHAHGHELACVILEPHPTNNGCIAPEPGFLELARKLTAEHGVVLIFDEVVSGFRFALGGGQELYGVVPDLCSFGKAFAGGLPIAGFGGRTEIMRYLDGNQVAHLGTYNSNALCAAGALSVLRELRKDGGRVLADIRQLGLRLRDGFQAAFDEVSAPMSCAGPGAVITVFASPTPPRTYRDTLSHNAALLAAMHRALLSNGIWAFSRGSFMVSAAHSVQDIDETIAVMRHILRNELTQFVRS